MKDPAEILAEARRTGVLTSDDRVSRDVLCIKCEYNQRTLAFDGNCPECNMPVVRTLNARVFVPRQWLEHLARGASALVFGAASFLISALLALAPAVNIGSVAWAGSTEVPILVGAFSALVGALMVTAKPPPALAERHWLSIRLAIRLTLLAGGCAIPFAPKLLVPAVLSAWLVPAPFVLLPFLLLLHLACLTRFLGRTSLACCLQMGGWAVLFALTAIVVAIVVLIRCGTTPNPVALAAVSAGLLAVSVAAVALLVPTAVALNRGAWPESVDASTEPKHGSKPDPNP